MTNLYVYCSPPQMLASHAVLLASVSGQDAPPPNMGRPLDRNGQPYEAETNQTMDELITSAAGGINGMVDWDIDFCSFKSYYQIIKK